MNKKQIHRIVKRFEVMDSTENINTTWFQQDGATPHTARNMVEWIQKTFGDNFISLKTDIECPPHSLNLSSLDFFPVGIP